MQDILIIGSISIIILEGLFIAYLIWINSSLKYDLKYEERKEYNLRESINDLHIAKEQSIQESKRQEEIYLDTIAHLIANFHTDDNVAAQVIPKYLVEVYDPESGKLRMLPVTWGMSIHLRVAIEVLATHTGSSFKVSIRDFYSDKYALGKLKHKEGG